MRARLNRHANTALKLRAKTKPQERKCRTMTRRTLLASFIFSPVASVFSGRGAFGHIASPAGGPRPGYFPNEIGRAPGRERAKISGVAVSLKKKIGKVLDAAC